MRWWPGECKAGDIIRIPLGAIHHYGVYIADDEVIQFGEPPVETLHRDEKQIRVCVTDITSFSCGQIIEIGEPEKGDSFRRLKRDKAVQAARSRVGEDGYSLLHNNCEHFAYECVFGVKYCEQEARTREKWLNRPVLDVYIAQVDGFACDTAPVSIPNNCWSSKKRPHDDKAQAAAESLLGYALKRSLNLTGDDVKKRLGLFSRPAQQNAFYAAACASGMIAVAVSRGQVRIAFESAAIPEGCALSIPLPSKAGQSLTLFADGEQKTSAHVRLYKAGQWQLLPAGEIHNQSTQQKGEKEKC